LKKKLVQEDEGWKQIKSFVGLKLNDHEKRRLWPFVKHLFKAGWRPNLSGFLKETFFHHLEQRKGSELLARSDANKRHASIQKKG
jgi:hypothetical protein